MKALIASIQEQHKQLNGIIHSAGMILDNFILKKTPAEFSQVLAPKVTGTINLDQASQDMALDFLVLFSSVILLWVQFSGIGGESAAGRTIFFFLMELQTVLPLAGWIMCST